MFAQIFGDGRPLVLGADALGNRDADIVEEDLILFVLVFYVTGTSRTVEALGPGDDAPLSAKLAAAASLFGG